jgi:hypothetical protein
MWVTRIEPVQRGNLKLDGIPLPKENSRQIAAGSSIAICSAFFEKYSILQ